MMRSLVLLLVYSFAVDVQAGGRRRGSCSSCQGGSCGFVQPQPMAQWAPMVQPGGGVVSVLPAPIPAGFEVKVKEGPHKTKVVIRTTADFDEVNAHRARRGLRPFIFDAGLGRAAQKCADIRAARCQSGHLNGPMSDFALLEPGVQCDSTGADGSKIRPGEGWFTCCTEDNYTYAGAGSAVGPDGYRYMSLFVRR